MLPKKSRIFVAGHRGLVGRAIVRRLKARGHETILTAPRSSLDLCNQAQVEAFFRNERPDYVFLAAAKVGGIVANRDQPAEFIRDNLLIQTLVIDAAYRYGVKKLLVLGSSCIYPCRADVPIQEEQLLSGPLEATNEAYAIAKIAGLKTAQAYRRQYGFDAVSLMPTNLYGPHDNFHPEHSHVIPGLMQRFHQAKLEGHPEVTLWGSGRPLREFLHVDDLAAACEVVMTRYSGETPLNVGSGAEVSIRELAELLREVVGYQGRLTWDPTRPDGTYRKLLDSSRLQALGWAPQQSLRAGLEETYAWFTAGGVARAA